MLLKKKLSYGNCHDTGLPAGPGKLHPNQNPSQILTDGKRFVTEVLPEEVHQGRGMIRGTRWTRHKPAASHLAPITPGRDAVAEAGHEDGKPNRQSPRMYQSQVFLSPLLQPGTQPSPVSRTRKGLVCIPGWGLRNPTGQRRIDPSAQCVSEVSSL